MAVAKNKKSKWYLVFLGVVCNCFNGNAWGSDSSGYTFRNGAFGQGVDISLFNQDGYEPPGVYLADVRLNGRLVDKREISFHSETRSDGTLYLEPCLMVSWLSEYGIRVEDFPSLGKPEDNECALLTTLSGAQTRYDFAGRILDIDIPQIFIRPVEKGVAPQARWNEGVSAFRLGYDANFSRTEQHGNIHSDSKYLRLNPGLNIGAWRAYHSASWTKRSKSSGKWESADSYLTRGINKIRSRLTIGDISSVRETDVFDGIPFRGVALETDQGMLPSWMKEFMPIVRGIAHTHARVTVRQNGYSLYSDLVAPGPFELKDLQSNGGGDLDVTVEEEDGSVQHFTVANTGTAIFLRKGAFRYNLAAGIYRPADAKGTRHLKDPKLVQSSVVYGLPANMTVYGGIQLGNHYQNLTSGLGILLGKLGAASLDVSRSESRLPGQNPATGTAIRLRYNKTLGLTGTTLALSNYQYNSKGYRTLSDVLDEWEDKIEKITKGNNIRNKMSVSISQPLGQIGSLSFSWGRTNYREQVADESYSAQYSFSIAGVGVSLYATKAKRFNATGPAKDDRQYGVNISLPLGKWLPGASATIRSLSSNSGTRNHQLALSGSAQENRLNWNIQQSYTPSGMHGAKNNGYMGLNWFGRTAQLQTGYSNMGSLYQTWSAGIRGGLLIHSQGITVGPSVDGTLALINSSGVSGIEIAGTSGLKTDWRGFAIKGWLSPYQENKVAIDPLSMGIGDYVDGTKVTIVPTNGAVIPVSFDTRTGNALLLKLTKNDSKPIPFGAVASLITDESNSSTIRSGIVDDNSQVYMAGMPDKGVIQIKWGNDTKEYCSFDYSIPLNTEQQIVTLEKTCVIAD